MEIIVGKYSGFCNGVKKCVLSTLEELKKDNHIYSLGDVVHNEDVIEKLKKEGLVVINNVDKIPDYSKVIIRAHGESLSTYKKLKEKHADIIDLTCGKVALIHAKILKHKNQNFIIIIGKKNHPETIAHHSFSENSYVIEGVDDIKDAYHNYQQSGLKSVYILAQTTFNEKLFQKLVEDINHVFNDVVINVDNTICNATVIRQKEVENIASMVNQMIIIGGKNSSNTHELAVLAKKYCENVYLIQNYQDLNPDVFHEDDVIGIEAGASTPQSVIDDVVKYLDSIYKKVK